MCVVFRLCSVQMDSIGVQSVLRLLPEETRHQLTSLPLSSLLNTAEGSHIFKRVVNAILLFYQHNPIRFSPLSLSHRLAVLYDVCDRLSSLCGGYFSIGEKLFNQGFILLSRVLEDAFHVDPHQLHVPSSQRIESRPRWTRSRWRFNTSTRTKPRATCRPCSTFSPSKRAS